jgi:hypothetical protein
MVFVRNVEYLCGGKQNVATLQFMGNEMRGTVKALLFCLSILAVTARDRRYFLQERNLAERQGQKVVYCKVI